MKTNIKKYNFEMNKCQLIINLKMFVINIKMNN